MAINYGGALYFGQLSDSENYTFTESTVPAGDWTKFVIVRLHHLLGGTAPKSVSPLRHYPWRAYTTSWAGGTGGNDCYIRIAPANASSDNLCVEAFFKKGGTNLLSASSTATLKSTATVSRNTPYVIAVVKDSTNVTLYLVPKNGSAVQLAQSATNASFGSRNLSSGIVGGLNWTNYIQLDGLVAQALTTTELESIAAGTDLETVVSSSGNRTSLRVYESPAATITASWGSNNATRNGTWTNRPTSSPVIPNVSERIECTEPIPYHTFGLAPNTFMRDISFSGTYVGFTPATFQGKVIAFSDGSTVVDWTNLTSFSASGGNWSGTMPDVPDGNQHILQIRDSSDNTKIWKGANPWNVGTTVITTGQSPMVKLESAFTGVTLTAALYAAVSTVMTNDYELMKCSSNTLGTGLISAANRFGQLASGQCVCFSTCAATGTSSDEWAINGGPQMTTLRAQIDATYKPENVWIYWSNGAAESGPAETIKANHDTILANMIADLETTRSMTGLKYVMIPYNRDESGAQTQITRVAQWEWATQHANYGTRVFLGWPWHDMQTDGDASGTAQGGAAGSITFEATDEATSNSARTGGTVTTTGGTGSGQSRILSGFNTSTKIATVTVNFSPAPDATTTYDFFLATPHPNNTGGCKRGGPRFGQDLAYKQGYTAVSAFGPSITGAFWPIGGDGSIIDVTVAHTNGTLLRTVRDGASSTTVYGFEVSVNNFSSNLTITSTVILSATQVRITLSSAPADKTLLKVRYLNGSPVPLADWKRLPDLLYDDSGIDDTSGLPVWPTLDGTITATAATATYNESASQDGPLASGTSLNTSNFRPTPSGAAELTGNAVISVTVNGSTIYTEEVSGGAEVLNESVVTYHTSIVISATGVNLAGAADDTYYDSPRQNMYPLIRFRVNLDYSATIGEPSTTHSQFALNNQSIGIPGVGRLFHGDEFTLDGIDAIYVRANYVRLGRLLNDPRDTIEVLSVE